MTLNPVDLLMPNGHPIGTAGSRPEIREVQGDIIDARRLFDELTVGGTELTPPTYLGVLKSLSNGDSVGLRPVSLSGPPTRCQHLGARREGGEIPAMTKLEPIERLMSSLIEEFEDDHVGLWSVIWDVRRAFPTSDPESIRSKTFSILRFYLGMGYINAGFPAKDGRDFEPWSLPPEGVIDRIKSEWKTPLPYPDIGEIVWFTSPT